MLQGVVGWVRQADDALPGKELLTMVQKFGRVMVMGAGVAILAGLMIWSAGCGGGAAPVTVVPGIPGTTSTLIGQVVDRNLQPVSGVQVSVASSKSRVAPVETDANGQYSFADLPFETYYDLTFASGTGAQIVGPLHLRVYLGASATSVADVVVQLVSSTEPNVTITAIDQNIAANGTTIDVPGEFPETPHLTVTVPAGAVAAGVELRIVNLTDSSGEWPGQLITSGLASGQLIFPRSAAYVEVVGGTLSQPLTVIFPVGAEFDGQTFELYQYNSTTNTYEATRAAGRKQFTVTDGVATATVEGPGHFILGQVVEAVVGTEAGVDSQRSVLEESPYPKRTTQVITWEGTITYNSPPSPAKPDQMHIGKVIEALSRMTAAPKPDHMPAMRIGTNTVLLTYCTPSGGYTSYWNRDTYKVNIQLKDSNGGTLYDVDVQYVNNYVEQVKHSQGGSSPS